MPPKLKKADQKPVGKGKTTEKPKRAPSPYIIFCTEMRPKIKEKHPDATFGETGKLLGDEWAKLDAKSKEVSGHMKPLFV